MSAPLNTEEVPLHQHDGMKENEVLKVVLNTKEKTDEN